jgi:hypothetical protein
MADILYDQQRPIKENLLGFRLADVTPGVRLRKRHPPSLVQSSSLAWFLSSGCSFVNASPRRFPPPWSVEE